MSTCALVSGTHGEPCGRCFAITADSAMMPRSGDEQEVDEFLEVGWSTTNGGYSGIARCRPERDQRVSWLGSLFKWRPLKAWYWCESASNLQTGLC